MSYRDLPAYKYSRMFYSPDDPAQPDGGLIGGAKPADAPVKDEPKSDADFLYNDPPKDGGEQEVKEGEKEEESALKTTEQMEAEEKAKKDAADAEKVKADKDAADAKAAEEKAKSDKAAAEARQKAYADAKTPEERKTAYAALDDEQKRLAYDAMSEDDRKALGIEAPVKPVVLSEPKMPDGVTLDKDTLTKATAILTGLKGPPTQEQFQELVDLYAKNATEFATRVAQGQYDKFIETRKGWVDEIKSDPEIGGKNLDRSNEYVAIAKKVFVDEKGLPEFLKALEITGAGDNPAFYRFMVAVGKAHKDDKLEVGDAHGENDEKSAADTIYDKS